MKHLYKSDFFAGMQSQVRALMLLPLLFMLPILAKAQTPFKMADGNYTQDFATIATWADDFVSGEGAAPFSKAAPSPTLPTQNNVFVPGSGGGVQKGTEAIVLLATGSTDGQNAAAFDLSLDFTGMTAGTLSLDWASVNNATGTRKSTFSIQANTGSNGEFVELANSAVTVTNNEVTTGSLAQLALPAEFSGKADAKLRFYIVTTAAAGTSGSRPKISLDNIAITAAAVPTGSDPVVVVPVTALPDFGEIEVGSTSGVKAFTINGQNLTGDLTITPAPGFEIRVGDNAFACCAITLAMKDGSIENTTVDVRFAPVAAEAYSGNITVSGGGATSLSIAVTGIGIAARYPATLATTAVTEITPTTAVTGGEITSDGGSPVTARGVVWATTANPTLENAKTEDGDGAGVFTSNITGLTHSTTYYVRAYATNAVGTTYGQESTFTTVAIELASEPSTASGITISEITSTSMKLTFANGDGAKRLVLARQAAEVDATPEDGSTYTSNAAFKQGDEIGTGNFVVYSGVGNEVVVEGLRGGIEYHFASFEFNDNDTEAAENYLTTTVGKANAATPAAAAVLAFEENFDYTAGSLLTDNGWTAHSGTANFIPVASSGLVYSGFGSSGIGNSAELIASGQDVNRSFNVINSGTPVYVAFMVNVTSASANGDYFLHLGPSDMGTSIFRSRLYVRATQDGKVQFGVSGSGATPEYTTQAFDLNTTHLLVMKYTFDEHGNATSLYVNPTLNAEPTSVNAMLEEAGDKSPMDINTLAIRQGSGTPGLKMDGIRVATSYSLAIGATSTPSVSAVSFTEASISKAEDAGSFNVSITLSEAATTEQTVTIAPMAGATATSADYTLTGATNEAVTVTIPANTTTATFEVNITDDADTEDAEQVVFEIKSASSGLEIGTAKTYTLTIEANDAPTGIADGTKGQFSVYPTIVNGGNVRLLLPERVASTANVTMVVYSAEGRKVMNVTGTQDAVQTQLSNHVTNLPSGIYMILIETGKEFFQTKMVKR